MHIHKPRNYPATSGVHDVSAVGHRQVGASACAHNPVAVDDDDGILDLLAGSNVQNCAARYGQYPDIAARLLPRTDGWHECHERDGDMSTHEPENWQSYRCHLALLIAHEPWKEGDVRHCDSGRCSAQMQQTLSHSLSTSYSLNLAAHWRLGKSYFTRSLTLTAGTAQLPDQFIDVR